jgi:hypothetical protein
MKRVLFLAVLALVACKKKPQDENAPPQPTPPTPAVQPAQHEQAAATDGRVVVKDGLATPESVLYDAASDVYIVSNINGAPAAADDNG